MQKQLDALPNEVCDRVAVKTQKLAEDPRPDGMVKLKGFDSEYRIRIGDYRVRYEINDEESTVLLLQCKQRVKYRDPSTPPLLHSSTPPPYVTATTTAELSTASLLTALRA